MTIHPSVVGQAMDSTISTIQSSNVHVVQSTTPKGTQQPRGKNKKGKDKKGVETIIKMQNMMQMLEGPRRRRRR
jgi:hypothetical protein